MCVCVFVCVFVCVLGGGVGGWAINVAKHLTESQAEGTGRYCDDGGRGRWSPNWGKGQSFERKSASAKSHKNRLYE